MNSNHFSTNAIDGVDIEHLLSGSLLHKSTHFIFYVDRFFLFPGLDLFGLWVWNSIYAVVRSNAFSRRQSDADSGSGIAWTLGGGYIALINHEVGIQKAIVMLNITPTLSNPEIRELVLVGAIMIHDGIETPKAIK